MMHRRQSGKGKRGGVFELMWKKSKQSKPALRKFVAGHRLVSQSANIRVACMIGLGFSFVFTGILHAALPIYSGILPQNDLRQHDDTIKSKREAELKAMKCTVMPPYEYTGKAMWIPAFQGSGNDMLRSLVQAITGLGGDGVYSGCFQNNRTATCKTHWPFYSETYPPNHYRNVTSRRVVMLLRNPKDSIPSSFNYKWERKQRLPTHSRQAPEGEWKVWRDKEALNLFAHYWMGQILTWKKLEHYDIAFYLSYERLVNIQTGPDMLKKLADELRSNGVRVARDADIPCLWYKVVRGGRTSRKTKRAPHRYVPSFTAFQQGRLLQYLEYLSDRFAKDDPELVDILSMYHQDIYDNMRIQNDDDDFENAGF